MSRVQPDARARRAPQADETPNQEAPVTTSERPRADTAAAPFVAVSEIAVPPPGSAALEAAFADRLGEVDDWPGFLRLEVWQDERSPGRYLMVSWWYAEADFRAYLASDAHRRSHARIPGGEHRPRPAGLTRYRLVAT
jgi:heme oxygenase (mycobilin-producing)